MKTSCGVRVLCAFVVGCWAQAAANAGDASPEERTPALASQVRRGDALRQAARLALRRAAARAATENGHAAEDLARELVLLHHDLVADKQLPTGERAGLLTGVRNRLRQLAPVVERATSVAIRDRQAHILAQQGVAFGQAPPQVPAPQAPPSPAEELIEAIQACIAPETWDVNGGEGVIRLWAPGNALVVRQNGAGHAGVFDVIDDLR